MYADLLLKQACIDAIEGDNTVALLALDAAIAVQPKLADAYLVKMQMEDDEDAAAVFDKLVKSVEHKVDVTLNDAVYYFWAECNAALGRLEEAVKGLTTCIDHGYELAQTYYQRAQVYAAIGDTENHTSDLENSLKYTNKRKLTVTGE